jgi:NAD(P)-dependent dehydrogenase (short-subunit alcohol dehydrogenase family)
LSSHWRQKVVLITGGSAGLGLAIARAFAEQGAKIVLAGRDEARLGAATLALRQFGTDVLGVAADVTRQPDVDSLIRQTIDRFGQLDVLVNNVGRSMRGEVLATTPDDFQAAWDVNFLSAVRCTQAAAEHLIQARGHIVNIGSLASKSAARFLGPYPAVKHALAGYSQQLRLELADLGVHVLLVCPGPIAREDGPRYEAQARDLPPSARKPGGGVKVSAIPPKYLAKRIIRSCERRQSELVLPGRARLLFALAQLSPRLGDWLLRRMT